MRVRDAEQAGRQDARSGIDLLNNHHPYVYRDEEGQIIESTYLGSVLSFCPSGKYYLPFACSNVELCPRCKGSGCDFCGHTGSREAYLDEVYFEAFDDTLEKAGCWRDCGEGDPLDIHVQRLAKDQEMTPDERAQAEEAAA